MHVDRVMGVTVRGLRRVARCTVVPCVALPVVSLYGEASARALRQIFAQLTPLHVVEAVAALIAVGARLSTLSGEARAALERWSSQRLLGVPAEIGLPAIASMAAAFPTVLSRAETMPTIVGDEISLHSQFTRGPSLTLWKVDPPLRLAHPQPLAALADGGNC